MKLNRSFFKHLSGSELLRARLTIPKECSLKIYTKTGDSGQTGLLGGVRVSKSHPAIETCGDLDEANSLIGLAIAHHQQSCSGSSEDSVIPILNQIQNDLFDLGSRVAASQAATSRSADFPTSRISQIESWIDQFQDQLTPLTAFILPGGSVSGAALHHARAVTRRTERRLVSLMESGSVQDLSPELIYMNRLGDFLFVLARTLNQVAGIPETPWKVTKLS